MKKTFNRISGTLLIIAAIVGLLFSIGGMVFVWQFKPKVTTSLTNGLGLLNTTLDATYAGLTLTQKSLENVILSVGTLQNTIKTIAKTFDTTKPLMEAIGTLLNKDLPNTITTTQTSLTAAQESAKVIDGVLRLLTIFNKDAYNPSTPLHVALEEVNSSLGNLPKTFSTMESNLKMTTESLPTIQNDLNLMADNVSQIVTNLAGFQGVIGQYQSAIKDLQKQIDFLITNLPAIINALAWALTVFLIWMAIAQIGLLTQGWELLHRDGKKENTPLIKSAEADTSQAKQ